MSGEATGTLSPEERVAAQFAKDTAEHQMTIVRNEGVYRHLRFRKPGTSMFWFDIVTWPGSLAIRGDMGTYVFSRLDDMFEFFGTGPINPDYWVEKLDAGHDRVKDYDEDEYRRKVVEQIAEWAEEVGEAEAAELRDDADVLLLGGDNAGSMESAYQALHQFQSGRFRFTDVWEWDLTEPSHRYLWCLHAITWGIGQYRAAKSAPIPDDGLRYAHDVVPGPGEDFEGTFLELAKGNALYQATRAHGFYRTAMDHEADSTLSRWALDRFVAEYRAFVPWRILAEGLPGDFDQTMAMLWSPEESGPYVWEYLASHGIDPNSIRPYGAESRKVLVR